MTRAQMRIHGGDAWLEVLELLLRLLLLPLLLQLSVVECVCNGESQGGSTSCLYRFDLRRQW